MARSSFGNVQQLHSGRFRGRYTVDGERCSTDVFDTRAAAQKALDAVRVDLDRGQWRDETKGKVLFRDFAEDYLQVKGAELAPGTLRNYRTLLNTMLLPTFGAKQLNVITKRHVQLWWAGKTERPVNRRNAFFCLRSIMNLAVEW